MSHQKHINIEGENNKVIGGNDNSLTVNLGKKGKLATLFEKLKDKFEEDDKISQISDDLKRYQDNRDRKSLEEKLTEANREHLLDSFSWLKEQYFKKLTKFRFYEPAQEIHAFILGIVFEKFRNLIYPLIRNNVEESQILNSISLEIVNPIVSLIQEEGCDDIMGLSSTEIEGMVHYLTGKCHINWKL
jgi:hypothetical protein